MMLDELATYLDTQGIGSIDHDLFKGGIPDGPPLPPDACITLHERPSMPPVGTHDNILAQERPRLQVSVRGARDDYEGPRQVANQIYLALAGIINTTLSGTRYLLVLPSPPFPIGRDKSGRYLICVNAEVTKNPS